MVTNYIDCEQARNLMRHKQDALTVVVSLAYVHGQEIRKYPYSATRLSVSAKIVCCKYKDGW